MLDYKEDDILTTDQLIKIVNENINYKNNKSVKICVICGEKTTYIN